MSIRQQIESDCDDAAGQVKSFKQAIGSIVELHSQLGAALIEADMSLRAIQSKHFISSRESLMEKVAKLHGQVDRVRELKNMMDIGTIVIATDRVMDDVWKSIP